MAGTSCEDDGEAHVSRVVEWLEAQEWFHPQNHHRKPTRSLVNGRPAGGGDGATVRSLGAWSWWDKRSRCPSKKGGMSKKVRRRTKKPPDEPPAPPKPPDPTGIDARAGDGELGTDREGGSDGTALSVEETVAWLVRAYNTEDPLPHREPATPDESGKDKSKLVLNCVLWPCGLIGLDETSPRVGRGSVGVGKGRPVVLTHPEDCSGQGLVVSAGRGDSVTQVDGGEGQGPDRGVSLSSRRQDVCNDEVNCYRNGVIAIDFDSTPGREAWKGRHAGRTRPKKRRLERNMGGKNRRKQRTRKRKNGHGHSFYSAAGLSGLWGNWENCAEMSERGSGSVRRVDTENVSDMEQARLCDSIHASKSYPINVADKVRHACSFVGCKKDYATALKAANHYYDIHEQGNTKKTKKSKEVAAVVDEVQSQSLLDVSVGNNAESNQPESQGMLSSAQKEVSDIFENTSALGTNKRMRSNPTSPETEYKKIKEASSPPSPASMRAAWLPEGETSLEDEIAETERSMLSHALHKGVEDEITDTQVQKVVEAMGAESEQAEWEDEGDWQNVSHTSTRDEGLGRGDITAEEEEGVVRGWFQEGGSEIFTCVHCLRGFVTEDNIEDHLKDVHGESP